MVSSMTGFASVAHSTGLYRVELDLKSLNSKHLDFHIRLPECLSSLEIQIRQKLGQAFKRGRFELKATITSFQKEDTPLQLNHVLIDRLLSFNVQIRQKSARLGPLSVADILKWPGVVEPLLDNNPAADQVKVLHETLCIALEQAITELKQCRVQEGQKLTAGLLDILAHINTKMKLIQQDLPNSLKAYQQGIVETFKAYWAEESVAQQRLQAEMALHATKIDVAEEILRFEAHCSALQALLQSGQVIGRKCDFLLQELNREITTLLAKNVSQVIAQNAVDIRVYIDQMREQVQNIE